MEKTEQEAITCLGKTFESEEERREYFREELREKLPELRKLDGFPIAEDEDIIELSDPPYYTACPNPWLNDLIEQWEKEKKELAKDGLRTGKDVDSPYASDVSEGRYSRIYRFHPYPTKVPHYTEPGDIVFDGFAGTGMAGVAAQECGNEKSIKDLGYRVDEKGRILKKIKSPDGTSEWVPFSSLGSRKSITNDLSPSATFISYNYNTPTNSVDLIEETRKTFKEVNDATRWMYKTVHTDGKSEGLINYMVWSDVFICPNCNEEIVFWDTYADWENPSISRSEKCPNCNSENSKRAMDHAWETRYDHILEKTTKKAKRKPVLINYSVSGSRYTKEVDQSDLELLNKIEQFEINEWFPNDELPNGDKTNEPKNVGITHVPHFYSKRNLYSLALFNSKIKYPKQKLFITKLAYQITELYRFTHQSGTWGGGGGPMAGTFYIPSLTKELRVLKQLKAAIKQRKKLKINSQLGDYAGSTGSFASLENLEADSVDYIFIDPPFGSNLNYSELAFLWESWLRCKTSVKEEAIESRAQNKGLSDYKNLILASFKNAYRVLKPGKWMTVEFSNTSAEIWNSIQTSIQQAGFIVANVASLDKKKGTYNSQNNPTSVKQDLVISCYKPSSEFDKKFKENKNSPKAVWNFVQEHLEHLPIHLARENSTTSIIERSPKIIYDRLVSFYVTRGLPVPIDSKDFQAELKQRYAMRDGMYFTHEQVSEYDEKKAQTEDFVQLSLDVTTENEGIEWLRAELQDSAQTYQDLMPKWRKATTAVRKGDVLPELQTILEQNFIQEGDGKWRVPNMSEAKDREAMRNKALLREFEEYVDQVTGQGAKKLKEARAEALRAGFKNCWDNKDFKTIVQVGEKIPENLLLEDDQLLMYYDIATDRV